MGKAAPKADEAKGSRKHLDEITREDYMETVHDIQEDMLGCMGYLVLLDVFLCGDPLEEEEDLPFAMVTMRNMVSEIRQCAKTALDRTFKVL